MLDKLLALVQKYVPSVTSLSIGGNASQDDALKAVATGLAKLGIHPMTDEEEAAWFERAKGNLD